VHNKTARDIMLDDQKHTNNDNDNKKKLLHDLYARYIKCLACPLALQGRSQVVFGQGNPCSSLMIIGEAPGQEEDLQGKPFVGRSGKLLEKVFQTISITREEIFITNSVKCRPPLNRAPVSFETKTCANILLFQEISIIKPKIICTLGTSAASILIQEQMPKNISMSLIRGNEFNYNDSIIIPTYHPAYALRKPKIIEDIALDIKKAYLESL